MADEDLLRKVHGLSDLELAQLLCLTSREHALISTPPELLQDLVEELQLVLLSPRTSRLFALANGPPLPDLDQGLWPQVCSRRLHTLNYARRLRILHPALRIAIHALRLPTPDSK